MNVPAIAKSTFEMLRDQPEFLAITHSVIEHLNKIKSKIEKARFAHNMIDEYNRAVFSHPLLKQFVPCKSGCSACCHTQVSVTSEEAELLITNIDEGIKIDIEKLDLQAAAGNSPAEFYKIPYAKRGCVFLDGQGNCRVYKDRPAVCRTNAVVGEASQCDTNGQEQGALRLVKTQQADMVIVGAFYAAEDSGTLPVMLSKLLKEREKQKSRSIIKQFFEKMSNL